MAFITDPVAVPIRELDGVWFAVIALTLLGSLWTKAVVKLDLSFVGCGPVVINRETDGALTVALHELVVMAAEDVDVALFWAGVAVNTAASWPFMLKEAPNGNKFSLEYDARWDAVETMTGGA